LVSKKKNHVPKSRDPRQSTSTSTLLKKGGTCSLFCHYHHAPLVVLDVLPSSPRATAPPLTKPVTTPPLPHPNHLLPPASSRFLTAPSSHLPCIRRHTAAGSGCCRILNGRHRLHRADPASSARIRLTPPLPRLPMSSTAHLGVMEARSRARIAGRRSSTKAQLWAWRSRSELLGVWA
jgi:hypothetical protein